METLMADIVDLQEIRNIKTIEENCTAYLVLEIARADEGYVCYANTLWLADGEDPEWADANMREAFDRLVVKGFGSFSSFSEEAGD